MARLWLIGGTQESRQIVAALMQGELSGGSPPPLLVSVTTAAAQRLYPDVAGVSLWVGRLRPEQGDRFITEQGISAILDASHPFATEISQLAIALAQRHQLPYLRYERDRVSENAAHWQDARGRSGNLLLPQLKEVFTGNYLLGERTLLTLGYRLLPQFQAWQQQGTLFARILPSAPALTTALAAGFTPDRLIALRPPISPALEIALWQQWQITQVITKASGRAGGEDQKQAIAAWLKLRLIRLARPDIFYPAQTNSLETAIQFVWQRQI